MRTSTVEMPREQERGTPNLPGQEWYQPRRPSAEPELPTPPRIMKPSKNLGLLIQGNNKMAPSLPPGTVSEEACKKQKI